MTSAAVGAASPNAMAAVIAEDIAKWTPYRAQVFADAAAAGRPSAYGGVPAGLEGFDSVLQVEITQFGFAGRNAGSDIALYMVAEARLLGEGDRQPIALRGMAYVSPWHAADLWTKADGALTRTELKRAQRALAERVVEHMFLDTPWPSQPGAMPSGQVCGVLPIASPGAVAVMIPGPQVPVKVDGTTPLLAWSAPLAPTAAAESSDAAAADDLRYDLRIFEEYDWGAGDLVYERAGLRGNEHRVESELKPATLYFWAVRARYTVDAHPRATRWSATAEPAVLDPLPSQVVYASRLAQGTVTRVACAAPHDFTPCGCLEFHPGRELVPLPYAVSRQLAAGRTIGACGNDDGAVLAPSRVPRGKPRGRRRRFLAGSSKPATKPMARKSCSPRAGCRWSRTGRLDPDPSHGASTSTACGGALAASTWGGARCRRCARKTRCSSRASTAARKSGGDWRGWPTSPRCFTVIRSSTGPRSSHAPRRRACGGWC